MQTFTAEQIIALESLRAAFAQATASNLWDIGEFNDGAGEFVDLVYNTLAELSDQEEI